MFDLDSLSDEEFLELFARGQIATVFRNAPYPGTPPLADTYSVYKKGPLYPVGQLESRIDRLLGEGKMILGSSSNDEVLTVVSQQDSRSKRISRDPKAPRM